MFHFCRTRRIHRELGSLPQPLVNIRVVSMMSAWKDLFAQPRIQRRIYRYSIPTARPYPQPTSACRSVTAWRSSRRAKKPPTQELQLYANWGFHAIRKTIPSSTTLDQLHFTGGGKGKTSSRPLKKSHAHDLQPASPSFTGQTYFNMIVAQYSAQKKVCPSASKTCVMVLFRIAANCAASTKGFGHRRYFPGPIHSPQAPTGRQCCRTQQDARKNERKHSHMCSEEHQIDTNFDLKNSREILAPQDMSTSSTVRWW